MSMQDPISDMLTRLRNAQMAGKKSVEMPGSKLKAALAKVLAEEGYIGAFNLDASSGKPRLSIELQVISMESRLSLRFDRVSRPSLRQYASKGELPSVRGGLGCAIVSTSKGVMTDRAARAAGVGGEVLCTVF